MTFVGVDVGGRRKGFHAAAVGRSSVSAGPERLRSVAATVKWLEDQSPTVIALDSPTTCAVAGERSRAGERALAKEICRTRWTPERSRLAGNPYYEWIVCGLELYDALKRAKARRAWEIIEVFPTASWTIWAGRRGTMRRARWTRQALAAMNLDGLPPRRLNQDDRDALAAAMTARCHHHGDTTTFGEIVVPTSASPVP